MNRKSQTHPLTLVLVAIAAILLFLFCIQSNAEQPNIPRPNWIGGSNDQRIYFGSGLKLYPNGGTNTYQTNIFDFLNAHTGTSRLNLASLQTSGIPSGAVPFFTNGAWSTSTNVGSGSSSSTGVLVVTALTNVPSLTQRITTFASSNVTYDANLGQPTYFLTNSIHMSNISNGRDGMVYIFRFKQPTNGGCVVTWNTNIFKDEEGVMGEVSTNASGYSQFSFWFDGTNAFRGSYNIR